MSKILDLKDNVEDDFTVEEIVRTASNVLLFTIQDGVSNSSSILNMPAIVQLRDFLNEFIEEQNEK